MTNKTRRDNPTATRREEPTATRRDGAPETSSTLLNLPSGLASRYRILEQLPTQGAEADLLLVEPLSGGKRVVIKLYRRGIHPKSEVLPAWPPMSLRMSCVCWITANPRVLVTRFWSIASGDRCKICWPRARWERHKSAPC
ncbi:hypothetical protein CCP4SC76_5820002 [Gammaproteobacteria bacterium]